MAAPMQDVAVLRRALLRFYEAEGRELPWRRERNPYAIWVSEIMLQQTQVETVSPRYEAFLRRYPTVQALADATEEQVCEAWAGLGYYRRARNLHKAARVVVNEHGGSLPATSAELLTLPGVGRYTAGAIASIAYDEPAPVVDGNVIRILTRIFALAGDPTVGAIKREVWRLAGLLADGPRPGDLNQAMMELGATVCHPRAPECARCPVRPQCKAHAEGQPERYPALPTRRAKGELRMSYIWAVGARGVWLRRRPLEGLWPGLWEPPSAPDSSKAALAEATGAEVHEELGRVTHALSHRRVLAVVYRGRAPAAWRAREGMRPYADPRTAPLSGLARKVVTLALGVE